MKDLKYIIIGALAGASMAACSTTAQTTTAENEKTKGMKVCREVKRTGSKLKRRECEGEPPLGLGVMNREAYRQANRGGHGNRQ